MRRHRKLAADMLRRLADEVERGRWADHDVAVENDLEDLPVRAGEPYAGKRLVGRTVTVRLRRPS